MQQYNVNFYDRDLKNIHHDTVCNPDLHDDYIAFQNNTIIIRYTDVSLVNMYIQIENVDFRFFGIVTDASPTNENTITIAFKNFLSIFDEDTLFDTNLQKQTSAVTGITGNTNSKSLEQMLKDQIEQQYVTCGDQPQRLKINVETRTSTRPWGFNLVTDTENTHYCIIGLYRVLIVNAMKKYGIALEVQPDFTSKVVNINIVNRTLDTPFHIDGNLANVIVKTLKANDRPNGVNKLIVYNTADYTTHLDFYVYSDHTWGLESNPVGKDRLTPVSLEVKSAGPDSSYEDSGEGFVVAAIDVAHSSLSGLEWDNLIELEAALNDEIVKPLDLKFGQVIMLHYNGVTYTSILTGKDITSRGATLIFGSERIKFSKRAKT